MNLRATTTERDVLLLFQRFGPLRPKDVTLARTSDMKGRRQAYVNYSAKEYAIAALNNKPLMLDGMNLHISLLPFVR